MGPGVQALPPRLGGPQRLLRHQPTVLGKKVGWCYREQPSEGRPDSGWRFFSGEEDNDYVNDIDHTDVYDLNTICNYDPDILPLLTAPVGTAYARGADGKFHAEQYTPSED